MASLVKTVYARRLQRFLAATAALALLLLLLSWASFSYGPAGLCPIHLAECGRLVQLRVPRTLSAIGLGASLAISGLLLQATTRNVLAEPSILGISSGALASYAAVVLVQPLVLYDPLLSSLSALIGGLLAYTATLFVAEAAGGSAVALILAGVAVTAATAGIAELLVFLVQSSQGIPFMLLLLGSVAYTRLDDALLLLSVATASTLFAIVMGKPLNTLTLGDEYSSQLGYSPRLVRRASTVVAAFAASTSVAVAGIVGFIGLIAPHLARGAVGGDNRLVAPVSALTGALVVLGADLVSRAVDANYGVGELPLGLYTGVIGGVFLAYLVATRMRRGLVLEASG